MGRPDISPARLRPTTKDERNSTDYCVLSYKRPWAGLLYKIQVQLTTEYENYENKKHLKLFKNKIER
jgi:hypothetical protein